MSEEELDQAEPELELDDEDLPDELDDDLEEDLVLEEDLEAVVDGPDDKIAVDTVSPVEAVVTAPAVPEEDEDVLDLDEELHPDDVEAPLDTLLEEKTAATPLEDDEDDLEEEDDAEGDERGEGPTRIVPRRAGEFVCSSCFLVLPRAQLADKKRMLCRDCA